MAIIKTNSGSYVIASSNCWLPGAYENERAARLAFRLPDKVLHELQQTVNDREPDSDKRVISYDEVLIAYRERRKEGGKDA